MSTLTSSGFVGSHFQSYSLTCSPILGEVCDVESRGVADLIAAVFPMNMVD
jgi:hypothetical protein